MIRVKITNTLKKDINSLAEKRINAKRHQVLERLAASTPVDTGKARDSWSITGNAIVNSMDYIENLNAGSSKQAPAHFVESAVLSVEGVKPNGIIVSYK